MTEQAIGVLRPGGRLMIVNLLGTSGYRSYPISPGMLDVTRLGLVWQRWNSPWLATRLVTETNPPG